MSAAALGPEPAAESEAQSASVALAVLPSSGSAPRSNQVPAESGCAFA
jgi:hypothetical protein